MYNFFNFKDGSFDLNAPGSFKRYLVILSVFAMVLYFGGISLQEFSGADEPRVAGIGTDYLLSGEMTVPRLNGKPFLEMPPMFYWAEAFSFKLLGATNTAARLPSAIAALWAIIVCYLFANRLGFKPFTAFCTAMVLSIAPQFWANGRSAMVDMMLASFTVTAVYGYYSCATSNIWWRKVLWMLLFAAAAGGGIMTKGLIGLAIPGAAIGSWLFLENIVKKRIAFGNWVLMFAGALLAFVPLAIWIHYLNQELGWEQGGKIVLFKNNLDRFAGNHNDHNEPFYYYLKKLPEIFQPWLVFVFAGFAWFACRFYKEKNTAWLMMLCYVFFPLAILNLSSVKRMVYLLPTNPAMALLAGGFVGLLLQGDIRLPVKLNLNKLVYWLTIILSGGCIIFFAIAAVIPMVKPFMFSDLKIFGFCGMMLAAMTLMLTVKREFGRVAVLLLVLILTSFSIINMFRADKVNRKEAFRPMFKRIAAQLEEGRDLILVNSPERIDGGAEFYLQRRFDSINSPEGLAAKLTAEPGKYLLLICDDKFLRPDYRIIQTFKVKKDYYTLVEPLEKKL